MEKWPISNSSHPIHARLGAGLAHGVVVVLLLLGPSLTATGTQAVADDFKKLPAAQIRAKLTGMQISDEVHWAEAYWPDGRVTSEEMGRKRTGRWRVDKDRLCTDYGKDGGVDCYEVWLSGRHVELRTPDNARLPLEGVLEKASNRH